MFFLDSLGITGKTFVQNTIMGKLRQEDGIVLAITFSNITTI